MCIKYVRIKFDDNAIAPLTNASCLSVLDQTHPRILSFPGHLREWGMRIIIIFIASESLILWKNCQQEDSFSNVFSCQFRRCCLWMAELWECEKEEEEEHQKRGLIVTGVLKNFQNLPPKATLLNELCRNDVTSSWDETFACLPVNWTAKEHFKISEDLLDTSVLNYWNIMTPLSCLKMQIKNKDN